MRAFSRSSYKKLSFQDIVEYSVAYIDFDKGEAMLVQKKLVEGGWGEGGLGGCAWCDLRQLCVVRSHTFDEAVLGVIVISCFI